MLFGIVGILLSSLVGAITLVYKFTGDLAPNGLKHWLNKIALQNWKQRQVKRLGFYNTDNPKCMADTGVIPCPEEDLIEQPRQLEHSNETDELHFYGIDHNGNGLYAEITRFHGEVTEASLHLRLNGVSYSVSRLGTTPSGTEFALGNFKLELVESMRCWRIWYNGILRNEENSSSVHGVLNFLWKPFDCPLDTKRDFNLHLMSQYDTKSKTFGTTLFQLSKILDDGYKQFGGNHGTIQIENGAEERVYLYGFRIRKWDFVISKEKQKNILKTGKNFLHQPNKIQALQLFGMCASDGKAFTLTATNDGWTDGHTLFPSNKKSEVTGIDVEPNHFQNALPKLFTITDRTCSLHIEIWPKVSTQKFLHAEVVWLQLTINGKAGRGLLLRKFERSYPSAPFSSIIGTTLSNFSTHENDDITSEVKEVKSCRGDTSSREYSKVPEIVSFKSEHGTDISVVGGKGASLAQLCQLSLHTKNFNTAQGFCVTTTSFKKYLPLDDFRILFSKVQTSNLDETCHTVMRTIVQSNAKNQILPLIMSWINDIFGERSTEVKFAVRSSGILEDGSELSCAGQNETFLGIRPDDIAEKVVACWASLFTPQSIQYRLNHGQPAVSEMAVVIQKMVPASAAGVLFTADPRTGNPFKIMISANYGLGESVVSASCDPDTITLVRSNSESVPDDLEISSKSLGSKKSKIILTSDGSSEGNSEGSTCEVSTSAEMAASYCISNEIALSLGHVAVRIERKLGHLKPVDIEWAVDEKGDIYILQCRSITSLDSWTDFELIHEPDSPYNTTFERLTHANTGEVMPGVISPLSLSVVLKILDIGIQNRTKLRSGNPDPIVPYVCRKSVSSRHRILLNVLNVLYASLDEEITTSQVASDLSVFGHRVMDEELHKLALERHGISPPLQKIRELFSLIMTVWHSKSEITRASKIYGNYKIDLSSVSNDAKKLYDVITETIFDLYQISNSHCMMSEASTVTQMFALLSLAQGRKADEWDSDIYEDVSKVLSVCMDVESADLPTAMDTLAKTVAEHGGNPSEILMEFVNASPTQGFHWLSHHDKAIIPESLEDFFEKHGHRCISELDLMRKSWKSDPIPFVNLLQSLVRNKIKFDCSKMNGPKINKYKNDEALLSSLHTKLGFIAKCFLKFLLPYCRRAVWNREKTKSYFVRTGDQLKQSYELLGQLMVKGQLLPNSQLLYFMSHQQIGLLLNRHPSSPKILYKAMRKMKLFPELNKEEYPEITIGIREPVVRGDLVEYGDSLTATPVSSGKVTAPAKVCMTIEEASRLIEPGDILITHGTDIGWSPFFPILGGIVTELGGLISHGAVVAREYGLPCIVGAGNATKIFKTGDVLLLDAGKGTITKVKVKC